MNNVEFKQNSRTVDLEYVHIESEYRYASVVQVVENVKEREP